MYDGEWSEEMREPSNKSES